MGHVFQHTYTVLNKKTGRRELRYSRKWYVEYWSVSPDGRRVRRREPGYVDRKATEHLLAELEREQARVSAGYLPSGVGLAKTPLAEHLADYLAGLRDKGDTELHVRLVEARSRAALDGCGFVRWSDLDAGKLGGWLAAMRKRAPGKRKKGISARTSNHYLQQFRGFVAWLAQRMGVADPLAAVGPVNVETDRRHVRRALAVEEFGRLVAAAAGSPVEVCCQAGKDRAMLYVVAAYTGLRASELASLTPELVQLAGEPATLTVEAGYSKRRRLDTIPLTPELAVQLKAWLALRPPGEKLWPGDWAEHHHAAQMLRADLAAAGIAYRDARGRVFDFHALRGQFITGLARAGVPLIAAQKLARHSKPELTSNYYTHLETEDLAREAAKLPAPPPQTGADPPCPE